MLEVISEEIIHTVMKDNGDEKDTPNSLKGKPTTLTSRNG